MAEFILSKLRSRQDYSKKNPDLSGRDLWVDLGKYY